MTWIKSPVTVISIMVVNALGILLLGEILSLQAYAAIGLVVLGFIVLALSP